MIGDVDIPHIGQLFLVVCPLDVSRNFFFELLLLVFVASLKSQGVLHFELFKAKSQTPLSEEGLFLLSSEPGGSGQLGTPEGGVGHLDCIVNVVNVVILDTVLVEVSEIEGPNSGFVNSVVDSWDIGVWRVRVETFSLDVVPVELLVVVLVREGWGLTHSCAFLACELLESLKVILLEQSSVIHIFQVVMVVSQSLVESLERVVHELVF